MRGVQQGLGGLLLGVTACWTLAQALPLKTSFQFVAHGRSVALRCESSPSGVCHFRLRLTSLEAPRMSSAAVGAAVEVFLDKHGASYCASEAALDAKSACHEQLITGGFHD